MNKWLFSFDARASSLPRENARRPKTFNLTLWCRGDLIKLSEQRDTITQSFLFLAAPACYRPKKNASAIFFLLLQAQRLHASIIKTFSALLKKYRRRR
jgi:hypothetical protein